MITAITMWLVSNKIDYSDNICPVIIASFGVMCSLTIDISLSAICFQIAF